MILDREKLGGVALGCGHGFLMFSHPRQVFSLVLPHSDSMCSQRSVSAEGNLKVGGPEARRWVDTAPAVFANDWPPSHYQLPLVAVATSNNCGQKASDFQERLGDNQIFALGESVRCASADLPTGYRTVCGTSHCKRTTMATDLLPL